MKFDKFSVNSDCLVSWLKNWVGSPMLNPQPYTAFYCFYNNYLVGRLTIFYFSNNVHTVIWEWLCPDRLWSGFPPSIHPATNQPLQPLPHTTLTCQQTFLNLKETYIILCICWNKLKNNKPIRDWGNADEMSETRTLTNRCGAQRCIRIY